MGEGLGRWGRSWGVGGGWGRVGELVEVGMGRGWGVGGGRDGEGLGSWWR